MNSDEAKPPNEERPEGGKDAYTRDRMQRLANLLDEELPAGWGFILFAYPFGGAEGRMNYISNGDREGVIKVLKNFVGRSEVAPNSFGKHSPDSM